jgi:anti-sigma regulatory factor (Ser/Thr protein kinase)
LAISSPGQAQDVPVTRLSLVSRPESVGVAREWLTGLLDGWGTDAARQNAELLVSEVVTNAVRHAAGGMILLAVTVSPDHLVVRVHDESSHLPVRRAPGETGGWGLGLLDELSKRWGVEAHARDGKSVWFEVGEPDRQEGQVGAGP